MNYDDIRDVIENTIKAFEAYRCYLQELEETNLIKLEEEIPNHLLLKLSFTYQEEEIRYPNIEFSDPRYGYSGFESILDYFAFQLEYDDFIYNEDKSYIDINKIIKWLDERVRFLKDLMFFDEELADGYYRDLCEIKESRWEEIKASSRVYQNNLKAHKLKLINNEQEKLNCFMCRPGDR